MRARVFIISLVLIFLLGSFAQGQVNWQRYPGNPVVPTNGNPPFSLLFAPSVLYDSAGGIYKMWFSSILTGGSTWNVSYATSTNGTNWVVYSGSPVLPVGPNGSFDSRWVIDPYVMRIGNEYRMYYTGYDGVRWQTGLATSPNGINWTKFSGNPILSVIPGSTWESVGANCPKVHFDGTTYRMMYSGYNGSVYKIGLATSTDGITFTRSTANPVLRNGAPGEWDANSAFLNSFIYHEGKMFVLYNGSPYSPVGFATSTDGGLTWGKYPGNPVFTTGSPGSWDGSRVTVGSLLVVGNEFRYWYTACNTSDTWRIGYATGSFALPTAPAIQVAPSVVNFGVVPVGGSATFNARITNVSFTDTLNVSSISSNNNVFRSAVQIMIVPPGSFRNFDIRYEPTAAVVDTGSLFISSNDPNWPVVRVSLRGQGFAPSTSPMISSIRDILEDQGKQVRVVWYKSLHDSSGDPLRIVDYHLWRRVGANNTLWDFIATIPAVQFEQYAFVAPTLVDSSRTGIRWSVFKVSAHTVNGTQTFFSAADSGYSVDNLPPFPPTNLVASLGPGRVTLNWVAPPDPDVIEFAVHRSTVPNFIPSESNRIALSSVNQFIDQNIIGSSHWYYRVAAVDSGGNQSGFSNEASAVITGIQGGEQVPTDFTLYQSYPNPFNPSSVVRYDIPERSHVKIAIYDLMGRVVATLVDEVNGAGTHEVTWNAGTVASGVYFYRMQAGPFNAVKRMVFMK